MADSLLDAYAQQFRRSLTYIVHNPHVGEKKANEYRLVKNSNQTTFKYFVDTMEKESFKIMKCSFQVGRRKPKVMQCTEVQYILQ